MNFLKLIFCLVHFFFSFSCDTSGQQPLLKLFWSTKIWHKELYFVVVIVLFCFKPLHWCILFRARMVLRGHLVQLNKWRDSKSEFPVYFTMSARWILTLFTPKQQNLCVKNVFWNLHKCSCCGATYHCPRPHFVPLSDLCTTPWALQKQNWKIRDLVQFPQHTERDPGAWGERGSTLRPFGLPCRSPLWKAHHVPWPGSELFYRPHVVWAHCALRTGGDRRHFPE